MAAWGVLNLNKPSGLTSRQVVNRVQRVVGRKTKVGHAGTLDPLATGVLLVSVGPATRLIETIHALPKEYEATFLLGRKSDTEDTEGQVTELADPPVPSAGDLVAASQRWTGRILQRPPAYSAIKVGGRRAYELARGGEPVELTPREIVVYRIEITAYDYPELHLTIECGSGTYVRSLGRDLADSLGTAAVMSALRRTAIGPFRIEEAVELESLTPENWTARLLSPIVAVAHLPQVVLSDEEVRRVLAGRTIACCTSPDRGTEFAAIDQGGRLIGIMTRRDDMELAPKRNFPPADEGIRP